MSNVFFLHHFERMWENSMIKYNTTIEDETDKILDFLEHNDIDKLILTRFDDFSVDSEQEVIRQFCYSNGIEFQLEIYGYGMRKNENKNYPDEKLGVTWCQGTRMHHDEYDVLDIEEFHHDLKHADKVYLAGAFEGECVLDQEAIFDEIGVNYEKVEGLVVGDYYQYEYKGQSITEFLEKTIEKYEEKMKELSFKYHCDLDFSSLAYHDPKAVEEIIDELKDELESNEKLEGQMFSVNSHFTEFSEVVHGVITNNDYDYDMIIELIDEIRELKDNTEILNKDIYYHGTFWEKPTNKEDDFGHEYIDIYYNDDEAVYISNSDEVANNFSISKSKSELEDVIPIVMKIEMELDKVYNHTSKEQSFRAFNVDLDLSDREHLYSEFKENNYNAFIIEDNYPEGHDIAVFNDIERENIKEVKAFINNKWTDYMDIDDMKEHILNISLSQTNKKTRKNKI